MALSEAQRRTLSDVRDYEVVVSWFTGIMGIVGAIAIGIACGNDMNKGGIAFGAGAVIVSLWCNRRRAEYKADIKYLQEQEGLP